MTWPLSSYCISNIFALTQKLYREYHLIYSLKIPQAVNTYIKYNITIQHLKLAKEFSIIYTETRTLERFKYTYKCSWYMLYNILSLLRFSHSSFIYFKWLTQIKIYHLSASMCVYNTERDSNLSGFDRSIVVVYKYDICQLGLGFCGKIIIQNLYSVSYVIFVRKNYYRFTITPYYLFSHLLNIIMSGMYPEGMGSFIKLFCLFCI